jgi:hypothetical protein
LRRGSVLSSAGVSSLIVAGRAAERCDLHRRLHPTNGKRRVYSRLFLARLLLLLDRFGDVLDELVHTVSAADQWISTDHDALLVGGVAAG